MRRAGLVLAAALLLPAASQAQGDPFNGVWALDAAQSGGGNVRQQLTITVRGEEETYVSDWSGQGQRSLLGFVVRYDGVPVATTSFSLSPDGTVKAQPMQVVARRTGATRRLIEHLVGGRVVRRLERSLTGDGQSIVSALTDFDADGQQTRTARLVFVKQPR
jgi:phage-related protein